jgi:predicted dienelactone hydrolase
MNTILNTSRYFPCLRQLPRLRSIQVLAIGLLSALATTLPGKAAEKIYFTYGPFSESLRISSLEKFAQTGQINSDLAFYFKVAKATDKTKQQFRELLGKKANLDPFFVSQFFNSQLGYDILGRLGQYLQTPIWENGKQSLRAGIVQAAFDQEEGLTLLNLLKKLPVNLYIDVALALQGFHELERVIQATEFYTQKMASFAKQESGSAAVDFAKLPDLRQPGPLGVQEQRWVLTDTSRNRQFYVLVFQPQQPRPGKTPVIIMSHGLGSKPEDFAPRAKHLASYGFLVALPQHPGSDTEQVEKLKEGLSAAYYLTSEFLNRPKDLSFTIDELERRNQAEFGGRLDLQNVGVAGHSFGGYGVLAVAGATYDFDFLQKQCDRSFGYLDTSLLMQCQVLKFPREAYNFRDPRVKAVFALNPVNYAVFGPKGLGQITIPAILVGGSDDPATPTVLEQAQSFPLLGSSTKYLALAEGQAHVNLANLDAGMVHTLDSIKGLDLASPTLLQSYGDALLLAFFETFIVGNASYKPYMQPAYMEYLSRDQKSKLFMISGASDDELKAAIAEFKSKR